MSSKPTKGTIVSFGNTPQAKDDAIAGLGTEDTASVIYLDVMANDLAGNGKALWATDDGISAGGDRPVDLLTQDAIDAVGSTALGAEIWITADGRIAYRMTAALRNSLQSLAVGQTATDSFTYAIQMGNNGTLSWAQVSFTVAGTNDTPTVANLSIGAIEDGPAVTGNFVGDDIDSDDDGTTLQYTLTSQPATGTLTNNGNGTFTYNSDGKFQELAVNETTTQSFTYTAKDKHGAVSAPATGTITITGVNDAPTLNAGAAAATEDGSVATVDLAVLGNDIDSDDDGKSLTYTLLGSPAAGSAGITGTTLSFDPGSDFQGLAQGEEQVLTLNVQAKDKHGLTAVNTITVTVTGTNDAPTVENVSIGAVEDGPQVTGAFVGDDVDSDDDGASIKYTLTAQPAVGTLTNNGNGSFTYDSNGKFQELALGEPSTQSFTYTATDKHLAVSASATGTITITGVNDKPTVENVSIGASEDGAKVNGAFKGNDIDSDDDGTTIQYTVTTQPALGILTNNGNGSFTYDSNGKFQELAVGETSKQSFTYTAKDKHDAVSTSATGTITVTGVNDDPVFNGGDADGSVVAVPVATVSAATAQRTDSGVLQFSDVDLSDTHTVSAAPATDDTLGAFKAAVTKDTTGAGAGGKVTWDYAIDNKHIVHLGAGESITETFTVTVDDGKGGTAEQSVAVEVNGINDAPIITSGTDQAKGNTKEDTDLSVSGTVTISDVDATDTHTWSISTNTSGVYGSATVDTNGKWTYTLNNGTNGVASAVQSLSQGQTVPETFTVRASDGKGGSVDQIVHVSVAGINDAAVIGTQSATITETNAPVGTGATLSISDIDSPQSFKAQTTAGKHGTFQLGTDGKWTYLMNGAHNEFEQGTDYVDTFSVVSADGTTKAAAVTVTIAGANDGPTLNKGAVAASEDGAAVTLDLAPLGDDVDTDDDGSTLIYTLAGSGIPPQGVTSIDKTTFSFDPDTGFQALGAGQTQVYDVLVKATDKHGAFTQNTVSVSVTGVNDAPLIGAGSDGSGAVTGKAPVTPFTVQQWTGRTSTSLTQLETWATTVAPNYTVTTGIIDYTDDPGGFAGEFAGSSPWPAASATGLHGTESAVNNNFFARITATLNVAAADTYTFRTYNDDGVFLKVNNSLIINDPGIHPENARNGSILLGPGSYPIELFFFEYGGEASLEFSYKNSSGVYGHVNLDPMLRDSGVVQFTDVDQIDTHTVSVSSAGATKGALTAAVTKDTTGTGVGGQVKWDYAVNNDDVRYLGAGESITETFTVTVNDGKGGTAAQSVAVVVNGINDAPVITSGTDQAKGNTKEDTDLSVSGTVTISDVDANDTHTWSIASNTSGAYGSAAVDGNGKWTYTLNNGTNGVASAVQSLSQGQTVTETFTVRASDGKGGNADQVVHVVVAGINDAAVIGTQSVTITESNAPESAGGTLTISDIDSTAAFNPQTNVAGKYGTFSLGADGKWNYAMNGAHNEFEQGKNYVDSFSVSSVDGTTKADAVTVTIAGTNDAPTAVNDTGALKVTSLASQLNTTTVQWVDWTQASAGQITGVINVPGGSPITVTYTGDYYAPTTQISGGTNFYTTPSAHPGDVSLGLGTYTSALVANGPTGSDLIALNQATSRTLSFSAPVDDLFFAVVSLNRPSTFVDNGYRFDQDFDILSYGRGFFGNGGAMKTALADGRFELRSTANANGQTELHGVIGIKGSVTTLTWDSLANETWNGFTVGTYGKAQTSVATGNLLANDTDPETNPLTVSSVNGQAIVGNSITLTLASGARVTVNKNGTYDYDENGAFVALAEGQSVVDTFTYVAKDSLGASSNMATASITVTGINDAPVAKADTASVDEDGSVTISVLGNDSDPDNGDPVTLFSATHGKNGTVSVSGGSVVYTPAKDFNGVDSFDYTLKDKSGATSTATVTVTVNPVNDGPKVSIMPPLHIRNGSFESGTTDWTVLNAGVDVVNDWGAANGSNLLDLNALHPGGVKQSLATVAGQTYTVGFMLSQNPGADSSTVRVSAGGTTRDYTFNKDSSPGNMQWQSETFTFTATGPTELSFTSLTPGTSVGFPDDAEGPALDNVTLVAPISVFEDGSTKITGISIADADAASNAVKLDLSVGKGTLTLATTAGLSGDLNGSDGTLSLTGSQAAINSALSSGLTYTPAAAYSGADTLTATVNDNGHTGAGGPLGMTVTQGIHVAAVNDAPTIAFQPLITNGSFEQPAGNGNTYNGGSTAITGWTVTGNDVDHIKSWQDADGDFSLDLDGFNAGGVKQTLATVPGQTYTIGFHLSQNHLATSSTVRVSAGGTVKDYVYTADTTVDNMQWQGQTFTFTANSTSTELSFASLNTGANGPALDNVVSVATKENTATTISGLSVADPDSGSNPINIQLSVAHGSLVFNNTAGLTALDGNGSDGTLSYAGSQSAINAALANGVVYLPAKNYSGADTLSATVNDAGHTGGGALAASTNVAIQVYDVTLPQPISLWLADGNAQDSIAPQNNGTLHNGVSFVAGRDGGQAFSFDGVNDYASIARELTNDFTVFGWMKTTQVAPSGNQFFHGDGIVYADVGGINNDFGISQVGSKIAFGTGNPDTSILSTSNVNTGNWVQFAAVRSGSTLSLWINGVMEASINTGNSGALATPPNIIFGANTVDGRYYEGQIDDIQFFDRALTPVEIVGVMNVNPV